MAEVTLAVDGLDSLEDERRVTTALVNEPGVCWATASAASATALVQYDPERTDVESLREVVRGLGDGPNRIEA